MEEQDSPSYWLGNGMRIRASFLRFKNSHRSVQKSPFLLFADDRGTNRTSFTWVWYEYQRKEIGLTPTSNECFYNHTSMLVQPIHVLNPSSPETPWSIFFSFLVHKRNTFKRCRSAKGKGSRQNTQYRDYKEEAKIHNLCFSRMPGAGDVYKVFWLTL